MRLKLEASETDKVIQIERLLQESEKLSEKIKDLDEKLIEESSKLYESHMEKDNLLKTQNKLQEDLKRAGNNVKKTKDVIVYKLILLGK